MISLTKLRRLFENRVVLVLRLTSGLVIQRETVQLHPLYSVTQLGETVTGRDQN